MRIVIDMVESDYLAIKNGALYAIGHDSYDISVTNAFKDATIIPEDHGDLIDRSKLHTNYVGTELGTDLEVYLQPTVDYAPAVISADRHIDKTIGDKHA